MQEQHMVDITGDTNMTYALSPMQQGMLFQNHLNLGSGVDIEQMVITLSEEVDVAALQQAWKRVVARHDILSTGFQWRGLDEPVQEVYQAVELPFQVYDRRDLTPEEQALQLDSYLITDRAQGFDHSQPPLMRVALFCDAPQHSICVWTFHHMLL